MTENGNAARSQPAASNNGDGGAIADESVPRLYPESSVNTSLTNSDSILDAVATKDAAWFKDHPGEENYVRPLVPGEYGPFEDQIDYTHVLVVQMFPGGRARSGLRIFHESGTRLTELVDYRSDARWNVTYDGMLIPKPPNTRKAWQILCGLDTQKLIKAGRRVKQ